MTCGEGRETSQQGRTRERRGWPSPVQLPPAAGSHPSHVPLHISTPGQPCLCAARPAWHAHWQLRLRLGGHVHVDIVSKRVASRDAAALRCLPRLPDHPASCHSMLQGMHRGAAGLKLGGRVRCGCCRACARRAACGNRCQPDAGTVCSAVTALAQQGQQARSGHRRHTLAWLVGPASSGVAR